MVAHPPPLHLVGNLLYGLDAGAIEVVLVAAGLDEEVGLNVALHLLHAEDKVVVSAVYFPFTSLAGGVWWGRAVSKSSVGKHMTEGRTSVCVRHECVHV